MSDEQESSDAPEIETHEESGVQEAPTKAAAIQIEEIDLLRYRLAGSEHRNAQKDVDMCQRELQHAQIGLGNTTQGVIKLVATLESKYKFSMQTHAITNDGFIVPIQQIQQRR